MSEVALTLNKMATLSCESVQFNLVAWASRRGFSKAKAKELLHSGSSVRFLYLSKKRRFRAECSAKRLIFLTALTLIVDAVEDQAFKQFFDC